MSRPRVFVAMPVYQSVQLGTFLAVLNMTGHVAADFEFGVSICRRWRAIGGKIHALLDCETVHYGVDAHPMNAMKWLVHETVLRTAGLQTAWNPADANAASLAHS